MTGLSHGVIFVVAARGGMEPLRGSSTVKWIVRCVDSDAHRSGDRHPSAFLDGNRNCFSCSGCGLSLSAKALAERLGIDWRAALDAHTERHPVAPPTAPPRPSTPAYAELMGLWEAAGRFSGTPANPHRSDSALRWFIARRRWRPELLDEIGIARVLPLSHSWPAWWPGAWAESWRIAVLAYSPDGTPTSLHARAVFPNANPKTRWPLRCSAGGLLFADGIGRAVLRGTPPGDLAALLVAEGLTDTVTAALAIAERGDRLAVLGGTSGSWGALGRVRLPNLPIVIATDGDEAGERYVREIRAVLPRADLRRWKPSSTKRAI